MSLDDALFLVSRGGTTYRVSGADIDDRMKAGDAVLVQRNYPDGTYKHFHNDYTGTWTDIEDDDLLLAWEANQSKHVTGATFKGLFTGGGLTIEEVQECHRLQYTEYLHCKTLCETEYCHTVCLDVYTHEVELCYTDNGFPIPPILIPPPRP